jgi:hypothetical protein
MLPVLPTGLRGSRGLMQAPVSSKNEELFGRTSVGEELRERSGLAIGREMPSACGCVEGAVEEQVGTPQGHAI